jgi:hypothetical protein
VLFLLLSRWPFKPLRAPELDRLPAGLRDLAGQLLDRVYWTGFKDGLVAVAVPLLVILVIALWRRKPL